MIMMSKRLTQVLVVVGLHFKIEALSERNVMNITLRPKLKLKLVEQARLDSGVS